MLSDAPLRQAPFDLTDRPLTEAALAGAVLAQAVRDLGDQGLARHRRRGALLFLVGSASRFWCDLSGLDWQIVRERARRLAASEGLI